MTLESTNNTERRSWMLSCALPRLCGHLILKLCNWIAGRRLGIMGVSWRGNLGRLPLVGQFPGLENGNRNVKKK